VRPLAFAAVVGGLVWLLCAGLFGGGALAQRPPFLPTFTPTRTPVRVVPTATPAPVLTATPLPAVTPAPGQVTLEFYAAVSLGAMRSSAIPSGRYWISVNGGREFEMRQPAAPGQAAQPIDGSAFSIPAPAIVTARLVRADGYQETYTFNLDGNRLITNQRTTAGYPVRSRVAPTPPSSLLAARH